MTCSIATQTEPSDAGHLRERKGEGEEEWVWKEQEIARLQAENVILKVRLGN